MASYRKLIHQLALSRGVARGTERIARRIRDRAAQIDADGDFQIVEEEVTVRGMRRRAFKVVDNSDDASVSEFGAKGVPAIRPLGRAARSFKG